MTFEEQQREDDVFRLEEIRDKIEELAREAMNIADDNGEGGVASSYWGPHIIGALHKDHEWLGGSMSTIQDTIDEIKRIDEDEEE